MSEAVAVSIIIPAFNEERLLPNILDCVRRCVNAMPMNCEIIVVDNNSNDSTAKVATEKGAIVVFEPINNIARARNAGANRACGDYLLFLDADCSPSPELFAAAWEQVTNQDAVLCGALVHMDNLKGFAKRIVDASNRVFVKRQWISGTFMLCTRRIFELAKGFDETHFASEDIYFSMRVKSLVEPLNNKIVLLEDPKIFTSSRKFEHPIKMLLMFLAYRIPNATRHKFLMGYWYNRAG